MVHISEEDSLFYTNYRIELSHQKQTWQHQTGQLNGQTENGHSVQEIGLGNTAEKPVTIVKFYISWYS